MGSPVTNIDAIDLHAAPQRSALSQAWQGCNAAATQVFGAVQEGIASMHRYEDLRAHGASHAEAVKAACGTDQPTV
jgi:hypothetical protein